MLYVVRFGFVGLCSCRRELRGAAAHSSLALIASFFHRSRLKTLDDKNRFTWLLHLQAIILYASQNSQQSRPSSLTLPRLRRSILTIGRLITAFLCCGHEPSRSVSKSPTLFTSARRKCWPPHFASGSFSMMYLNFRTPLVGLDAYSDLPATR